MADLKVFIAKRPFIDGRIRGKMFSFGWILVDHDFVFDFKTFLNRIALESGITVKDVRTKWHDKLESMSPEYRLCYVVNHELHHARVSWTITRFVNTINYLSGNVVSATCSSAATVAAMSFFTPFFAPLLLASLAFIATFCLFRSLYGIEEETVNRFAYARVSSIDKKAWGIAVERFRNRKGASMPFGKFIKELHHCKVCPNRFRCKKFESYAG
jgi:hypothetical protein